MSVMSRPGISVRSTGGEVDMARIAQTRWLTMWLTIALVFTGTPTSAQRPCWTPPVEGSVVDPFREPACPWCAGNRGIEYRVAADADVRVAATGIVVFAAPVAGVRYVVVELPNGWRHTYGRLTSTSARVGEVVVARAHLGNADTDFYFGMRIGDAYVDPAPYLSTLVGRRRLVPVDATPARPSGARSACPADGGSR